jgi:hypothetical protein
MAIEYDLQKNIRDFDVCTKFDILKVKVPISFLGTVGFSLRRDGRYLKTTLKKFEFLKPNSGDGYT